jgi:hypothetical protein
LWLAGSPATAAERAHVGNRCPRLSSEEYEELDARVLLRLQAESAVTSLPTVVCTSEAAWVEWDDARYEILSGAPLVDEVIDSIEVHLRKAPGTTASTTAPQSVAPERGPAAAPPKRGVPKPADRIAVNPEHARGGGISLGIETELPSEGIAVSSGPAFDFAASVGPVLIGGRESIRFTLAGRRVSFMDVQLLIGYGAPFDPSKRFGIVLRGGPEWMVVYPEGNSGQTAVAPVVDLGLRVAHHWGALGVWLGVDARARLSTLVLRSRDELMANDLSGSVTLGAAFVDWSRK